MRVSEQVRYQNQVSKLAHKMINNANCMCQALYHLYSSPEKSQQKYGDNAIESDSTKDTFENNEMENTLKSMLGRQ